MIDRKELAAIRERQEERKRLACGGTADEALTEALVDLDLLLEHVDGLAEDNERLARMVADVTEVVAEAREKTESRAAEAIARVLQDEEEGGGGSLH